MKVTFTIPADEGQAIYLIQDSGTSRLAKKVAVGTSAGTATFDFFESTDSENEIDRLSEAMLRAYDGDAPTEDAPIAYFVAKQGDDSVESDLVMQKRFRTLASRSRALNWVRISKSWKATVFRKRMPVITKQRSNLKMDSLGLMARGKFEKSTGLSPKCSSRQAIVLAFPGMRI